MRRPRSAWHQWNKHGRCSGLSAQDYYDLVRQAVASITLPAVFNGVNRELRVDPDVLAFFRAGGAGYQTRINAVLKAYVEEMRKR